jgi:hypothetical protein
MASTYTLNNGIELIATGEQSGTWGDTTNENLALIDTALDGQVTVTLTGAGTSGSPNDLSIVDGADTNSEGRNRLVIFDDSSDLGATAYVRLNPSDAEKIIYIRNDLSGSQDIIVFQGVYNASNDYVVPNGTTAVIFFNGGGSGAVAANVFNNAHFDALNVVGAASFEGAVTLADDMTLTGASYNVTWDASANTLTANDSASINLGTSGDFVMTHTGSRTQLKEPTATSAGVTIASDGTVTITDGDTTTKRIESTKDGSVELYYDGTKAVETTTDGATVTGKLTTTTGLDVGGSTSSLRLNGTSPHGTNNLIVGGDGLVNPSGAGNTVMSPNGSAEIMGAADNNTIVGYLAGGSITTGSYNVAVGYDSLDSNNSGNNNTAVGRQALSGIGNFDYCVGVGYQALSGNSSGEYNVGVGVQAGTWVYSGDHNIAIGNAAMFGRPTSPISGASNIAIGYFAGGSIQGTSEHNIAIGDFTLDSYSSDADYNIAIGHNAGAAITTGQNNIIIGSYSGNSTSPSLDIRTSSNYVVLSRHGGSGAPVLWIDDGDDCYIPGVYSNTSASAANVYVDSNGELYRSTSSLRYKENVQNASHGLADLMALRSVTYTSKDGDDTVFGGLIAEEVHDAGLTEFVEYDAEGRPDALHYGQMVSLCIKSIQELKTQLDAAKKRISELEE